MLSLQKSSTFGTFSKGLILALVLLVGFSCGTSITTIEARHHHGPEWIIRHAGGNVVDLTRLGKMILYSKSFEKWRDYIEKKWGIKLKQSTPDKDKAQTNAANYENTSKQITASHLDTSFDSSLLKLSDPDDGGTRGYDAQAKSLAAMENTYRNSAINAAQNKANTDAILASLETALNSSQNTQGEVDARQAGDTIEALKGLSLNMLSQNLSDRMNMKQADAHYETMQESTQRATDLNNTEAYFFDPYDPDDRALIDSFCNVTGFKIYESKGMPDF